MSQEFLMNLDWPVFCLVWGAVLGWAMVRMRGRSRLAQLALCALFLGAMAAACLFWNRQEVRAASSSSLRSVLPAEHAVSEYISSESCQACHPDEFASWHRSFHRTMTQPAVPEAMRARFSGTLEWRGETFELERRGNEFWVKIDAVDKSADRTPPVEVRLSMITGSHHMQVFWLPAANGNGQLGFPFTWLIEDRRWAPRNDTFIRDPHSVPGKEIWNLNCIRCHSTAGVPEPPGANGVWASRTAELSISCEACHGPAGQHVRSEQNPARRYWHHFTGKPDKTIVQPQRLDSRRGSEICGNCHSMKWFKAGDWEQHGFGYLPGRELERFTPIIRPKHLDQQPWLEPVLRKEPEILRDFFWSDGMVRVTGREYNGLVESACYRRGELSCLSCHSMHRSAPDGQLAEGMASNEACFQCHDDYRRNLEAHTHHRPNSSGSLCYNCHMPYTSYGILKAVRAHQINNPSVRATLETGRPNACNLCHLDQTLDWTARELKAWYGERVPELPVEQRQISSAVLGVLRGDAGQRALWAWSMGWEPARRLAGDHWQIPFLAELLDDPYAAVRYMAWHSLQKLPGVEGMKFDYAGPEAERGRARDQLLEGRWQRTADQGPKTKDHLRVAKARGASILLRPDGSIDRERMTKLLRERNDRPVRLRE